MSGLTLATNVLVAAVLPGELQVAEPLGRLAARLVDGTALRDQLIDTSGEVKRQFGVHVGSDLPPRPPGEPELPSGLG